MKTCTKCYESKPIENFHNDRTRPDGKFPYCKPCKNEHQRGYKGRDPQKSRKNRTRLHGMTPADYDAMLEAQAGTCAICRQGETATTRWGTPRSLAIDHCHTVKVVRGLLCYRCNLALGYMADDPGRLGAAADYLEAALALQIAHDS